MSEETLIRNSSPTLAGIKTANLFSCEFEDRSNLMREIRAYNKMLVPKGIAILVLKTKDKRALIYVYRPKLLERNLRDELSGKILARYGYNSPKNHLSHLISRFDEDEFPHETGIFLGYPPEDVIGFIENDALNYKFSGLWKVYGNVDEAKRKMDSYRRCTNTYLKMINRGYRIDNLAVSI